MSSFKGMLLGFLSLALACALGACGGGGSSGGSDDEPVPPGPQVKLSGTISYIRVPYATDGPGLDYVNAVDKPARGVVVEALNASDAVLDSTVSDDNGSYSLSVPQNTDVRVRAKAQLLRSGTPGWDVKVTDNTQGNALYSLTGSLADSGTEDSNRDLLAASGWDIGANEYTGTRAAGPFAIADTIYNAQQVYLEAQPNTVFEPLELRWSVLNITDSGDLTIGEIGTSFYDPNNKAIYILGAENNDTDEYDESVVAHEWWHYLEGTNLRADSLGGPHTIGDRLDMRVAFSEGVGNAWAGVANGSPLYLDTGGASQSVDFVNSSLESNDVRNPGWYSESSVQSIFYDLLDTGANDDDSLSISLATVTTALATEYKQSPALASIFSFVSALKNQDSVDVFEIDQLVEAQSIKSAGSNEFGLDETNSAGSDHVLPVYTVLTVDAAGQNVCSINTFGNVNKLSNFRFFRFSIANTANYRITATRTSGLEDSDPDIAVYRNGERIVQANATRDDNREQMTAELTPGQYVMEVVEFANRRSGGGGETCFDVFIETQ